MYGDSMPEVSAGQKGNLLSDVQLCNGILDLERAKRGVIGTHDHFLLIENCCVSDCSGRAGNVTENKKWK